MSVSGYISARDVWTLSARVGISMEIRWRARGAGRLQEPALPEVQLQEDVLNCAEDDCGGRMWSADEHTVKRERERGKNRRWWGGRVG
jgi:hypothetical protein